MFLNFLITDNKTKTRQKHKYICIHSYKELETADGFKKISYLPDFTKTMASYVAALITVTCIGELHRACIRDTADKAR